MVIRGFAMENMGRKLPAIFLLLVAGLVMVASTPSANAKVTLRESVRHYAISGKSAKALAQSFDKSGTKATRIESAIGATRISFAIKDVVGGVQGNRCMISDVHVSLELQYILPKWRQEKRAGQDAQRAWRKLYKAIVSHEKIHGGIAKATAKSIERSLLRTSGRAADECEDMIARAKRRLTRIERRDERRHGNLDRRENRSVGKFLRMERDLYRALAN